MARLRTACRAGCLVLVLLRLGMVWGVRVLHEVGVRRGRGVVGGVGHGDGDGDLHGQDGAAAWGARGGGDVRREGMWWAEVAGYVVGGAWQGRASQGGGASGHLHMPAMWQMMHSVEAARTEHRTQGHALP